MFPTPTPLNLFVYRHSANWSRGEVATMAGISVSRLEVIENGIDLPTAEEARALQVLFGLGVSELLLQCKDPADVRCAERSQSYSREWGEDLRAACIFLLELGFFDDDGGVPIVAGTSTPYSLP